MKIKRGFLAMVLAGIFAFGLFSAMTVYANEPTIAVTVDGQRVVFNNQQPAIIDGRTLVPVRDVFELLGFEVQFDTDTQQITLTRDDYMVVLTIGSATFTTNGISHNLDVPAQIIGGSTMIPIRAVLISVGYHVGWDGATSTVVISSVSATGQGEQILQTRTIGLTEITGDLQGQHYDGIHYFVNVILRPISDNIKSVRLSTDSGFFAVQYLPPGFDRNDGNTWTGAPFAFRVQDDGSADVFQYGDDVEVVGSTLTLTNDEISRAIVFLSQDVDGFGALFEAAQSLTLSAVITLNDGQIITQTIAVEISDRMYTLGLVILNF